jgi:propanol-preferring alcohol dehydrogenase
MPIGDLDPITTVSLTDAGLTPYHAIKSVLPKLTPGSTAVVIGAGGLGHVAIQILKAITSATVVALDLGPQQLEFAKQVGADHTFPSDPSAIESVKELTGGLGATVVFDFVGIQPTADLAVGMIAIEGEIVVVGVAGGAVPVGYLTLPFDVTARVANWGSRSELLEVLALAKAGKVRIHVEEFTLDQAPEAYEKLHNRQIQGRAVVVPTR